MNRPSKSMLRVVWICHFSNAHIQEKLKVRKKIAEFAPWISLGIEEIKKREDIELHIISPHRWIIRKKYFSENNIHFHFFNPGIPLYGRRWPKFFRFDYFTLFYFNRRKIKKAVKKINPDIINLHGVENAYYSSSVFDFKSYPVLITIQGLKSLRSTFVNSFTEKRGRKIEQKILKEFENYGIRVKFLEQYIKNINPNAKFHWFKYPFKTASKYSPEINKTYDCVFFAKISKEKGIEDLIEAIEIVKQRISDISLKVIGGCRQEYKLFLQNMINEKKLSGNIEILGFLPKHSDVHKMAAQAKLSILPTYKDVLPGTIIESLKNGIPVIAYAANGVVDFNSKQEIIQLVETGDVNGLAKAIISLINDPAKRKKMTTEGLIYAKEEVDNAKESDKMSNSYQKKILQKNQ